MNISVCIHPYPSESRWTHACFVAMSEIITRDKKAQLTCKYNFRIKKWRGAGKMEKSRRQNRKMLAEFQLSSVKALHLGLPSQIFCNTFVFSWLRNKYKIFAIPESTVVVTRNQTLSESPSESQPAAISRHKQTKLDTSAKCSGSWTYSILKENGL